MPFVPVKNAPKTGVRGQTETPARPPAVFLLYADPSLANNGAVTLDILLLEIVEQVFCR